MLSLAIVLAGLGAWELYVRLGSVDELLLPAPSDIVQSLVDDRALLWSNFTVTATEVGLGILLALAVGFALAVALHLSRTARRAVYPLLVASQAIPIVVVAPLLVIWFGYDLGPKLAIIALVSFFPIVVVTLDALGTTDRDLVRLLRSLDATRWQRLRFAELPAAAPAALSGAKIAVAVAVIGAVFAESVGSEAGLGHLIMQSLPQFETARAWAAVVVLAAFAVLLVAALATAERRLTRIPPSSPSPEGPS
ncbi:MAG: ABC transporter permease subunit [Solirubrobacteraceae bacterium]|nr:ABC transporter permease subunit [Solirubrobacteraceae bacterium]